MGLRLKANSDDFLPYTKFNAKDGHWYSKDDAGSQFQVKEMTASVDLEKIRVGWIRFEQDAAPDAVWDADGCEAAQPSPQHKRGFSVRLYSPKNLGGLREFMSNSSAVNAAMVELYSAFEDAPERLQGLVPVVRCEGVLPIKSRHGQNYRPVLRIARWVERPDALNGGGGPKQPASEVTGPWALPVKPEPLPTGSEMIDDDLPEF